MAKYAKVTLTQVFTKCFGLLTLTHPQFSLGLPYNRITKKSELYLVRVVFSMLKVPGKSLIQFFVTF